jgi:hypothetical protein
MAANHEIECDGSVPIPRGWRGWARKRAAELRDGGVSYAAARKFAEVEARGRATIAASLGENAARAARLAWVDEGEGNGRHVLCGLRAVWRRFLKMNAPPGGWSGGAARSRWQGWSAKTVIGYPKIER